MTVVEHHSVDDLQGLFRQAKDAGVAKRTWIVWQARLGRNEPQIPLRSGCLAERFKGGCSDTTRMARRVARSCRARLQADPDAGRATGRRSARRARIAGRRCVLAARCRLSEIH